MYLAFGEGFNEFAIWFIVQHEQSCNACSQAVFSRIELAIISLQLSCVYEVAWMALL